MPTERRRVVYSGHVQGVGFRFTCLELSRDHDVVGHVRNLPDGQVELVVEGRASEVDAFLAAVRAVLGHYIRHESALPEPAGGPPYTEFVIRH